MRPGTGRNIGSLVLILRNLKGLPPQKISDWRFMPVGVKSLQKMCSISSCNISVQKREWSFGHVWRQGGPLASLERTYATGTYVAPICRAFSKLVHPGLDERCFRCIVEGYVAARVAFGDLCPDYSQRVRDAQNAPSLVHIAPTERAELPRRSR
jgi:hypothetical protein